MLGGGISNRTWETITEHATRCTLDDKIYLYRGAAGRVLLVFNSIWKAIGAIFDDQNFQNLDKLTPFQMVCTPNITFLLELLLIDHYSHDTPHKYKLIMQRPLRERGCEILKRLLLLVDML